MGLLFRLFTFAFTLALAATATAGTVRLDGIADGDTCYIEQPSDGKVQVDVYDPPPRQTQQRFHSILDPSVTYGNTAYDGFPNDANFRLGRVTYDESGLVGGTGIAPITGLMLGIGNDPTVPSGDPVYYNYYRWVPLVTTVTTPIGSLNGTVTLVGGVVRSIDFDAAVKLTISPFTGVTLDIPGTFSVHGNRFDGHMEVATNPNPNSSLIYDMAGTLTTVVVPEPSSLILAVVGCAGLGLVCRRRRSTPKS